MPTRVVESRSVADTLAVGAAIARASRPGDIIALDGELGAGKTQLVRGIAQGLGLDPRQVASPTFVIAHEYEPAPGVNDRDAPVLVHIDAYRLTGPGDLDTIGWGEDGRETRDGAVVAIEWATRIAAALGDDLLRVTLEHTHTGRRITLLPQGNWQQRKIDVNANTPIASKCPICKADAPRAGNEAYPFCSDRCRKIDMGRWFDQRYTISRPVEQADLEEGD